MRPWTRSSPNWGRDRVDELVCLGDVPVGPQPVETLERVGELGCPVIMGNWDAWFLDEIPQLEGETGRKLVEQAEWSASQLSQEHRRLISDYRPTLELALEGGTTLLCFHGSPRSFDDVISATTPEAELERMLSGFEATLMVGGHTHFQLLRRHRDGSSSILGASGYRSEAILPESRSESRPGRSTSWSAASSQHV